jgi:small-conductance mechanosensitive channel
VVRVVAALAFVVAAGTATAGRAQVPAVGSPGAALNVERAADSFTLFFYNRPIAVLRARVAGRGPAERAVGAGRLLHDLVAQRLVGPVEARPFDGGAMIRVGERGVFAVTSADVDDLAGETLEGVTALAVARLQRALAEAEEARKPAVLLRDAMLAVAAIALAILALWILGRGRRRVATAVIEAADRRLAAAGLAEVDALHSSRALDIQHRMVGSAFMVIDLVVIYAAGTFALRQFPYTRPWGESMSGFLLMTVEALGLKVVHALPGLFTIAVIVAVIRFVIWLLSGWFTAVEQGKAHAPWLHPETAQPTRRLVTALLWIFAIVVAYPYMPGSQSEAFKGVSVFLGLMVTFGSSGLVNQIMSGFMITYSRALRVGDFVRIGEVEGTVVHLGVLSTKVKTLFDEDVTIPNAVVVGQTTTDYSRSGDTVGVFTPTSVTIGYDAPWRQVHALLLGAAERTAGLRAEPKPFVIQAGLEDFYVKYTLLTCLERQQSRLLILDKLHANIQDLFNEHGVQIMSPNYVFDPTAPKIVAKDQWFAPPARRSEPV